MQKVYTFNKFRDRHGLVSPHRCMVWVVAATASGQDIAAQAPPVAVPQVAWVVWLFLHAHCEPLHHFPKRWIAFRLPLIVNTFGRLSAISATFSAFMAAFS